MLFSQAKRGMPLTKAALQNAPSAPHFTPTMITRSQRPSAASRGLILGVPPKPQARGPLLQSRRPQNRRDVGQDRTLYQHILRSKIAASRDPNEGDCTGPIETVTRYKWDEVLLKPTPLSDDSPIP